MGTVQTALQTVVAGFTAYTVGRSLAEEWRRGRTPLDELKRAWDVDTHLTVLTAGAGLALLARSWMKNRQLLVAAGVGALVGSGLAERALEKLGAPTQAARLEPGPAGTTPTEARALRAWGGRDVTV